MVRNQGPAGRDLEHHQITEDEHHQAHAAGQPSKPGLHSTLV